MEKICVNSFSLSRELPNYLFPQYGGDKITILEFPKICVEEIGLNNVELCQMQFPSVEMDFIEKMKESLKDSNVNVTNICVDIGTTSEPNPEKRKEEFEIIKRWFSIAKYLGSPSIRVNPDSPLPRAKIDSTEDALQRAIYGYKELAVIAREIGVKLLIENHGPGMTTNPDNIIKIIEEVGPDIMKTLPDLGNAILFPAEIREEGIRKMSKYASIIHAKTVPNEVGEKFLKPFMDIVKKTGFDGFYSLELPPVGKYDQREGIRNLLAIVRSLI